MESPGRCGDWLAPPPLPLRAHTPSRHDRKGGDFYLATSEDPYLATNGDFFMATDRRQAKSREASRRAYKPRPPRPPTTCVGCGTSVPAPKSGRLRRWCEQCRATNED